MTYMENDALSLEYKLLHGYARRNLDVSDIVNNPVCLSIGGVPGDGLKKEVLGLLGCEARPVSDDRSDLGLIRND